MSNSVSDHTGSSAVIDELREAGAAYQEAQAAVKERGRDRLETLQDAYNTATQLLAQYEDTATDTGAREFVNFAQFKGSFITLVENLDAELPAITAFERAKETIDKRRLDEDDFAQAREHLGPVEKELEKLDRLDKTRDQLITARQHAQQRREELVEEIEQLEAMVELSVTDDETALKRVRKPVEKYNTAVRTGFKQLRREAPSREVLALLDRAQQYPLVAFQSPPPVLEEYLRTTAAGHRPLAELIEFTEYSRSKLEHYVDDAGAFRRAVATNRTYLRELDATPLTIAWPPPPAQQVPWLTRELRAVAGRIVDADAMAHLREVEAVAREDRQYTIVRETAIAEQQLDATQRQKLANGTLRDELETLRNTKQAIDTTLSNMPDP